MCRHSPVRTAGPVHQEAAAMLCCVRLHGPCHGPQEQGDQASLSQWAGGLHHRHPPGADRARVPRRRSHGEPSFPQPRDRRRWGEGRERIGGWGRGEVKMGSGQGKGVASSLGFCCWYIRSSKFVVRYLAMMIMIKLVTLKGAVLKFPLIIPLWLLVLLTTFMLHIYISVVICCYCFVVFFLSSVSALWPAASDSEAATPARLAKWKGWEGGRGRMGGVGRGGEVRWGIKETRSL